MDGRAARSDGRCWSVLSWMDGCLGSRHSDDLYTEAGGWGFTFRPSVAGEERKAGQQDKATTSCVVQHQPQGGPGGKPISITNPQRPDETSWGGRSRAYDAAYCRRRCRSLSWLSLCVYSATPIAPRESQHNQDKALGHGHVALPGRPSSLSPLTPDGLLECVFHSPEGAALQPTPALGQAVVLRWTGSPARLAQVDTPQGWIYRYPHNLDGFHRPRARSGVVC